MCAAAVDRQPSDRRVRGANGVTVPSVGLPRLKMGGRYDTCPGYLNPRCCSDSTAGRCTGQPTRGSEWTVDDELCADRQAQVSLEVSDYAHCRSDLDYRGARYGRYGGPGVRPQPQDDRASAGSDEIGVALARLGGPQVRLLRTNSRPAGQLPVPIALAGPERPATSSLPKMLPSTVCAYPGGAV